MLRIVFEIEVFFVKKSENNSQLESTRSGFLTCLP